MQKQFVEDDRINADDLDPTDDFLDPVTKNVLDEYNVLMSEFEYSLANLGVNDEFDTALIVDNAEDVSRLLKTNLDLNSAYPWQRLFDIAVDHGKSPKVVKLCLDNGANVNSIDPENKTTSLVSAIQNRASHAVCQVLVDANIDLDGKGTLTHLQHAILHSKIDLIKALVRKGAELDSFDSRNNRGTPLKFAISNHCVDSAIELLARGANPNLYNSNLLHIISSPPFYNEVDENRIVASLIKSNIDKESMDPLGRTALLYAVHESRMSMVKTLFKYGCNIKAVDSKLQNALLILVKSPLANNNIELCEFLLSNGVDPLQKPANGLWSAVGWIEKLAIEKICDVNVYIEIVKLFIKKNININKSLFFPIDDIPTSEELCISSS